MTSNKKVSPGYEKFIKATDPRYNAVTIILRSHLLVEYYMDLIIMKNLKRGDVITRDRFTFSQKRTLLMSMDIKDFGYSYLDSIKGLNTVRNSCSHELDYEVNESDADKIGSPFGKEYLMLKKKYGENIKILLHRSLALLIAKLQLLADMDSNREKQS